MPICEIFIGPHLMKAMIFEFNTFHFDCTTYFIQFVIWQSEYRLNLVVLPPMTHLMWCENVRRSQSTIQLLKRFIKTTLKFSLPQEWEWPAHFSRTL